MATYDANINIVVSGQQRLDYVLNSVTKLNAITAKLKPINLLAPGAGAGGDAIRVAKKQLDDFARALVNFQPQGIQRRARELSSTLAGSAEQANALKTALANVGLQSGGFKNQAAEVKNYALALDQAGRNAARLEVISRRLQREARIQNIATRFNTTPEAVQERLSGLSAAVGRREQQAPTGSGRGGGGGRAGGAISSALIGGGFPLLFGQGPGAAAGGALGGLAGGLLGGGFGFALSIVGTALGDVITKSEEFNRSLATLNSGLSAAGSSSLTTASDVSKLASSLSVTKEEAIELLSTFKQFRDGDTREALAGLFAPVGGAGTFEAIAKAGLDEKSALTSIFSLRKEIGNEAATQLALQLRGVGVGATQAALLDIILKRSVQISVAQASQVKFTDTLLSIWEKIVAGVSTALSLAVRFIAKLQEGTLIKLPFLDQIAGILGGVTARTDKQIAEQRGQNLDKELKANIAAVRKALAEETKVSAVEDKLRTKDKTQNNNALFNEQARQAEQLARNQIALDNAIFRNKMALADEEFAVRQRIAELQGRLAEAGAFGAQREVIALINATSSSQSEYFAQARQLSGAIAQATQELKSANAMVGAQQAGVVQAGAGGMSQGRYMQGGIGPRGANQYGPHFDIKRSDGGYYSRTALDKYVQVNGRPLSSGVTVPGGEFGAPRSYGGHAGRDYAFGGKAAMTLTGGAKFISSKAGSYGDATAFMTPDGKVYKVIHGKFEGTTQAPTGQVVPQSLAKGQSQVIGAGGDVAVAQANEAAQIQLRKVNLPLLQQELALKIQLAAAQGSEFLRNAQEQTLQIEREIEKRKIRNRLALEGVAPEIIEGEMRVYDVVKQKEELLNELNVVLSRLTKTQQYATEATLQSALADLNKKETTGSLTEAEKLLQLELRTRLGLLKQIKDLEEGTPAVVEGARGAAAAQVQTPRERLEGEAGRVKEELAKLTDPVNMITNAAAGIGDAFAASFKGIVDGSMTAQQGLASFFKSVADMFLDMAAQIIAKWIQMIILNTILSLFPGGAKSGGGGGFTASGAGFGGSNSFSTFNAGGATAFGNPAFMAEGGFVTGPTSAVIGEGGESEYVIPASKMQSAMSRYSRGARGEGVLAGSGGGTEGGGGAAAAGPMVVDVRYNVERINTVDYVTASQFQSGMQQAAQQGAQQGEQRTLRKLQMSNSTRRRVGV